MKLNRKSLILLIRHGTHGGVLFDERVAEGLSRRIDVGEALAKEPGLVGLLADIAIILAVAVLPITGNRGFLNTRRSIMNVSREPWAQSLLRRNKVGEGVNPGAVTQAFHALRQMPALVIARVRDRRTG